LPCDEDRAVNGTDPPAYFVGVGRGDELLGHGYVGLANGTPWYCWEVFGHFGNQVPPSSPFLYSE
jgi:hypothetical protein